MVSKDIWCVLKFLPYITSYPWKLPISCEFCKCNQHIKFIGVKQPSKRLHAIWLATMAFHLIILLCLVGILFIEINQKNSSLSVMQVIAYCGIVGPAMAAVAPVYFTFYIIRDGSIATEMMKLESRLLKIGRNPFRCKCNSNPLLSRALTIVGLIRSLDSRLRMYETVSYFQTLNLPTTDSSERS